MKSTEELRALSVAELDAELLNLRKLQFKLRLKRANEAQYKQHEVGQIKKTVARVKTLLTEKADKS